jgi:hypothetical protein
MILWLYNLGTVQLGMLVIGAFIAAALGGMMLTRPWIHARWGKYREAVGFHVSAIGVIYAVLLAMIAVAAWQNYSDIDRAVAEEANALGNLFHDAEGYSDPVRARVQDLTRAYVRAVQDEEWPAMRQGRRPTATAGIKDALVSELARYKPRDAGEAVVHAEAFRTLNRCLELRVRRITSTDTNLLSVLWAVVLIGGVLNIGLTFLFTCEDVYHQALLTASYAASVGLMVFLILALDHPLWGKVSVGPESFQAVGAMMDQAATGAPR